MKTISGMMYAQRPLIVGGLYNTLAVGLGESEVDPDNIPNVEDMLSVCASLVTLDNRRKQEEHYTSRPLHHTGLR